MAGNVVSGANVPWGGEEEEEEKEKWLGMSWPGPWGSEEEEEMWLEIWCLGW